MDTETLQASNTEQTNKTCNQQASKPTSEALKKKKKSWIERK